MPIDDKSYFSNSIPGAMTVAGDVDIFTIDATPKLAVGTKMERQDGNTYRYAHIGEAVAAGRVVSPDLNQASYAYSANAVIATNSAFQQATEITGVYPGMKDSRFVAVILGTQTADKFAGSYLGISSGTGLGYSYRVKGNQVSSGTATIIELYDKIKVGLDATADITITPCKYNSCISALAGTTRNGLPVGVLCSAAAATSSYGWILTKGLISVFQSGGLTSGIWAALSQSDAGAVEIWAQDAVAATTGTLLRAELDNPLVGLCVQATADSGHCVVNVALE